MGLRRKGARRTTHVLQNTEMNSRSGRPGVGVRSGQLATFPLGLLWDHCEPAVAGGLHQQQLLLGWAWKYFSFIFLDVMEK